MNQTFMGCYVAKLFRLFSAILLIALMTACGGGGGSAGTVSGGSAAGQYPNGKIGISLFDQSGSPSNVIAGSSSLLAKVTVLDKSGAAAVGVVVTFAIDTTTAVLSPLSGTALTDSSGVAQISLKPGVGTGAGTLTASAAVVGTTVISASTTFSVSAPPAAIPSAINFVSAVPDDKSLVIKGAGGNGRTEVAILTYSVIDSSGTGIANVKVNFSVVSNKPVTLSKTSEASDSSGKVTVALSSGAEPTTVRVIATVDNSSVSSMSDTITITTGAPVQAAMSISLSKFYSEGTNVDGERVVVSARLADAFGGAVADNTQVVFTTDVGAVTGIGGAQCQTNKPSITGAQPFPGFCEIYWYSQNPRGNGVANIIATATSGSAQLSQSVKIYVLGSYAKIYQVNENDFEGSTTRLTSGGTLGLDFSNSCNAKNLNFEIVDENDNPMPPDSKISVSPLTGFTISTASPSTVPMYRTSIGETGHRGTVHSISITPPPPVNGVGCQVGGVAAIRNSFFIEVKSPLGLTRSTQVDVLYRQ